MLCKCCQNCFKELFEPTFLLTIPQYSQVFLSLTLWLSGWMVDLQVKRLSVGPLNDSDVTPGPFVCLGQRVGPPVRPVNLSSVHGDRKGMGQILVTPQYLNESRTVIFG